LGKKTHAFVLRSFGQIILAVLKYLPLVYMCTLRDKSRSKTKLSSLAQG